MRIAIVVALAACDGGDPDDRTWSVADFVAAGPLHQELVPADDPEDTPIMLRQGAESWQLRDGWDWDEAQVVATPLVTLDDGLWLDDAQLLPADLAEGATGDGVAIVALGEATVYYGTFASAVVVEVDTGVWAGEHVFAQGHGPVRLTWFGKTWDLAGYTWLEAE